MTSDIIITMPDFEHEGIAELVRFYEDEAKKGQFLYYKVSKLPAKQVVGGRCYIISNGHLIGSHQIVESRFVDASESKDLSDGDWAEGNYIIRDAKTFRECKEKIPDKGFRGFRYVVEPKPNNGC
jgi:hypothetical protein